MASQSLSSASTSLTSVEDTDDDESWLSCSCKTPAATGNSEPGEVCEDCRSTKFCFSLTDKEKWFWGIDEKQRNLNEHYLSGVLVGMPVRQTGDVHWTKFHSEFTGEAALGLKIPGARELGWLLREKFDKAKKELVERLKNVRRVATTADAWYDKNYIYLASTVHWIDEKTLERRNAYLGLTRLHVRSSDEVLMRILCEYNRQFGLEGKIALMTVNSASNFQKVFEIFGEDPGCPIPSERGKEDNCFYGKASDNALSSDEEDDEESFGDEDDEERCTEISLEAEDEAVPVDEVIRKSAPVPDNAERRLFPRDATPIDLAEAFAQHTDSAVKYNLPKYIQCAARTLTLVATEDAAQALSEDGEYPRLFTSVAGKLKALWYLRRQLKKTLKSASKEVYGIGKGFRRLFLVEVETRWDASYGAFSYIATLSDQEKKHLNEMLKILRLSELGAIEFAFISEYVELIFASSLSFSNEKVLKPLVGILSLLLTDAVEPGEHKNFGLGYLVPSLVVILAKAGQMLAKESERALKFCTPLLRAIKAGIQKRFEDVMKDEEFLLAAAVHPMFRVTRIGFLSKEEAERIVSVVKERAAVLRRKEEEEKENESEPPSKKLRIDERLGLFDIFRPTSPSQLRSIKETAYSFDIDLFLKDDPQDDLSALGPLKKLYAETNVAMPACRMVARLFPHEEHMDERLLGTICFLRANAHVFCREGKPIL